MTFREICEREDCNESSIILYREGIFLRAYGRSAYLLVKYVHPFKVTCRFVKNVNRFVCSVGFPAQVKERHLHRWPKREAPQGVFTVLFDRAVDEVGYLHWEEQQRFAVPAQNVVTSHTSVILSQPVFKTAYDLLIDMMRLMGNVAKTMVDPLALEAKRMAYALADGVRVLYDVPDRNVQIDKLQRLCGRLDFTMQSLVDLRQITPKAFALATERIGSVSSSLGALRPKDTSDGDGARNDSAAHRTSREGSGSGETASGAVSEDPVPDTPQGAA